MQPNKVFEKQIESYSLVSVKKFPQNHCSPLTMPYPDVKKIKTEKAFWLILLDCGCQKVQVIREDFYCSHVIFCLFSKACIIQLGIKKRSNFKVIIGDQEKKQKPSRLRRFDDSPFLPCCFNVLAERWIELPCPPVCGNFRSGKFPSVLILATSSSAQMEEKRDQDKYYQVMVFRIELRRDKLIDNNRLVQNYSTLLV